MEATASSSSSSVSRRNPNVLPVSLKSTSNSSKTIQDLADNSAFASYLAFVRQSFEPAPPSASGHRRHHSNFHAASRRRRPSYDGELDIFGAEKYFSETFDAAPTTADIKPATAPAPQKRIILKSRSRTESTTASSEASGGSRSALLRDPPSRRSCQQRPPAALHANKRYVRVLPCRCCWTKAVEVKTGDPPPPLWTQRQNNNFRSSRTERTMMSLPVGKVVAGSGGELITAAGLSSNMLYKRSDKSLTISPASAINTLAARPGGGGESKYREKDDDEEDDGGESGTDSSSDLFEINSLSINSGVGLDELGASTANFGYEPSIAWSVVTESAAGNFSVATGYDVASVMEKMTTDGTEFRQRSEVRDHRRQGRSSGLMGCVSQKAVHVVSPSGIHKNVDGAVKPEVDVASVSPVTRHQVESLKKMAATTSALHGRRCRESQRAYYIY